MTHSKQMRHNYYQVIFEYVTVSTIVNIVKSHNDEHLKNHGNLIFAPAIPEAVFREAGCFLGEHLDFTRFLLAQDPSSFDTTLVRENLPNIMVFYTTEAKVTESEFH